MATAYKLFHFVTDTEGWTPTAANANTHMDWRRPHRNKRSGGASRVKGSIAPLMGGCLRQTAKGSAAGSGFWELATTWESLGVPAGKVVTSVTALFQYRWDMAAGFAGVVANANKCGPFELRSSSGTLVGTFFEAASLPTTGHGGNSLKETHYPTGTVSTGVRTSDSNRNWANSYSDAVSVPAGMQASSSPVKFRLNTMMQAVTSSGWSYLRLKIDRVQIVMTYADPVTTRRRVIIV